MLNSMAYEEGKKEEEIHPFTSVSSRRARALSIERK